MVLNCVYYDMNANVNIEIGLIIMFNAIGINLGGYDLQIFGWECGSLH